MKKHSKIPLVLFLIFFIIVSALSIAGVFSKDGQKKVTKTGSIIKKMPGGEGPIHLSTSLDNQYYYDNSNVYLYVDLKSDKAEGERGRERTPLNIAIVIDKSGSMADKNKLEYVKKAVDYIIDESGRDDYVSVVTFDDYVDVVQRSSLVKDKYDLRDKVSHIKPGGFTNLSDGMFEGYDQVNRSYSRGYVNRVFLLTDGLANRGITDRYELADKVRDKNRRDGITISTFGVGNDFNENLLADLADYGKGNYYYIRNSSDIPEIFASELRNVRDLIGQGTKLKIHFPSGYLSVNKVFGYPYDISGNEITIDFKDVFSEQTKSVLIKFDIKKKIDSRLDFESELTYEDVYSNFRPVTLNDSKSIEPAGSKEEYTRGSNETVVQNISMFETNDLMEQALREADNGDYSKARLYIKDAQEYMSGQMNQVAPSPEMRRQSESMEKYDKDLESVGTKTEDEKKEMQKSGKYDNYNLRKKNQ
jgi:Ca-activated chloride channel family protein